MLLMSPPEGILFKHLILLEILSDAPSLVIGESQSVFLEQSVNSRYTTVPRIFKIVEREPAVLSLGLFSLEGILGPDTLTVNIL